MDIACAVNQREQTAHLFLNGDRGCERKSWIHRTCPIRAAKVTSCLPAIAEELT